jgi:hypothetical protein
MTSYADYEHYTSYYEDLPTLIAFIPPKYARYTRTCPNAQYT